MKKQYFLLVTMHHRDTIRKSIGSLRQRCSNLLLRRTGKSSESAQKYVKISACPEVCKLIIPLCTFCTIRLTALPWFVLSFQRNLEFPRPHRNGTLRGNQCQEPMAFARQGLQFLRNKLRKKIFLSSIGEEFPCAPHSSLSAGFEVQPRPLD